MDNRPWVEKYRPTTFENIVLDDTNKTILENIIVKNIFPNLLFYGPPGTGKTTTIINLINKYQEIYNQKDKSLKIHLNASDDRGIEVIRNQINNFVNTKTFFTQGLKFVILDEVDYMTKNAQQALHYLIQQYSNNIRFCLICNYVSKIDTALQNEFIHLRFSQLPKKHIFSFLKNIVTKENVSITNSSLNSILNIYKSDIRSMINFIQSSHTEKCNDIITISDDVWIQLTTLLLKIEPRNQKTYKPSYKYLIGVREKYDLTFKNIINDYFTYLIKYKKIQVTSAFLTFVEKVVHSVATNDEILINYVLGGFAQFSDIL